MVFLLLHYPHLCLFSKIKYLYIRYGAPDSDIERYVEKVSVPEDKFELYMEMRAYQRAADVAFKLKDEDRLREVSRACNDNVLERQIGEMIGRL